VDGHAVAYPRSYPSMRSFERHGDRSITFSLPRGEQTAQNPAPREVMGSHRSQSREGAFELGLRFRRDSESKKVR
jgi:hypothetical protein